FPCCVQTMSQLLEHLYVAPHWVSEMYRIREDAVPLAEVVMGPGYVPGATCTVEPALTSGGMFDASPWMASRAIVDVVAGGCHVIMSAGSACGGEGYCSVRDGRAVISAGGSHGDIA